LKLTGICCSSWVTRYSSLVIVQVPAELGVSEHDEE
jgi:hypothetical protein